MNKRNLIIIPLVVLFAACNETPPAIRRVLELSGDNRPELEQVITHYQGKGNKEKLKAAYYLIGNMADRYYWDGEVVTAFDSLFRYLDSLHRHKVYIPSQSPRVQEKWAALVDLHGSPAFRNAEKYIDRESLTAEYLISHIDQAFLIRDRLPWGKRLTFEEFCHYILPYRIGTERPVPWNRNIYEEYQALRTEIKAKTRHGATARLHKQLEDRMLFSRTLNGYPFDIPESMMRMGRRGVCRHLVYYSAMVMRANGLPVDVDFVPLWGNRNGGHFWNVLLQEDGSSFPFDMRGGLLHENVQRPNYTFAKAYRKSFALQPEIPVCDDIPTSLRDRHRIDVTAEYTRAFDMEIPLTLPAETAKEYALICTFDNQKWRAQAYGAIRQGHATFRQMGANVLYLAMYYDKGVLYPASDPFVLREDGTITYIRPKGMQDMTLLRKFPRFPVIEDHQNRLLGARFQGANQADFRDSVNLFTIGAVPDSVGEVLIGHPDKFRYVRLVSGNLEGFLHVAELEFRGDSGSSLAGKAIANREVGKENGNTYQSVFDGDPDTYFYVPNKKTAPGWVGIDFGRPQWLTRIRFAPRSDTNFILIGDTYELCYWDRDRWVSLGKQVADRQKLLYRQVPANGLYLLHNLTKGKEERIFTYEYGKQIWW